jgi:hypothetical protein
VLNNATFIAGKRVDDKSDKFVSIATRPINVPEIPTGTAISQTRISDLRILALPMTNPMTTLLKTNNIEVISTIRALMMRTLNLGK